MSDRRTYRKNALHLEYTNVYGPVIGGEGHTITIVNEHPRTEPLPQPPEPELGELFGRQTEKEQLRAWCDEIEASRRGKVIFLTGQQIYEPDLLGQWFVQEAETWGYHVQQVHLGGEREPQRWIAEWRKFAQRYYYDGVNIIALNHINELDTVWAEPLTKFAVEVAHDLPLLLLIPLNVPVPLQTIPELNPWHGLAQDLVTRELAHEIHLQAVTRADIVALMEPANPVLPPLLHDLCRGEPRLARDVWGMWQETGLVWQDRQGMWQADTQQHDWQAQLQQGWAHLVRDHLVALLGKENPWLAKAEAMLRLAALEGETFTLEAVALCLGVVLEGEDFEAWIDFCDDYLAVGEDEEEVGDKLLVPAGDVAGSSLVVIGYPVEQEDGKQKSRTVNRYRFAKPYLYLGWQKLQDVGGALLQERCEQLAEQLVVVYTPHLQLVLDALTRLYEAAGKPKRLWEEVYTPAVEHQKDVVALRHHAHRALAQWQGANQRSYELAVRTIEVGLRYVNAALRYDATYWEDAVGVGQEILPLAEQWPESLLLKEASVCNALGALLQAMGELAEARPYYARALVIHEKVLGAEHPDTATSLNNMGYLLQAMGELAEARPYYARALAIREKVLGAEHPDTAASLNNMGGLLRAMGELAEARPYHARALAIWEKVLGAEHPDTATSLNNMGALLDSMGELAEARPYYARALAICEKVLGAEHPDTAASLNNMGYLLQAMGELAEARPYYARALAIYEKVLGAEHPDTATSLNNLAILLAHMKDYPESARLMRRALDIWEQKLGSNHPNTQTARQSLAAIEAKLAQS